MLRHFGGNGNRCKEGVRHAREASGTSGARLTAVASGSAVLSRDVGMLEKPNRVLFSGECVCVQRPKNHARMRGMQAQAWGLHQRKRMKRKWAPVVN